jgi:uncharacterized protein (DUF2267 family)
MIASTEDFAAHVAAHAGITEELARRLTREVLEGLGQHLSEPGRQIVAEELPPELGAALWGPGGDALPRPIMERASEPGTSPSQVRELVASVCRVLEEELSDEALRELREAAPVEVAELLQPPGPELVRTPAAPQQHETLASGRAGSHHPLSEAHPGPQPDSVAADNPHASTKLSSSRGTTQERLHDTLAEGVPASEHPVAGRPSER